MLNTYQIMKCINNIDNEIFEQVPDVVYYENNLVLCFTQSSYGSEITFCGQTIWDSENESFNEDSPEEFEKLLRTKVRDFISLIRSLKIKE